MARFTIYNLRNKRLNSIEGTLKFIQEFQDSTTITQEDKKFILSQVNNPICKKILDKKIKPTKIEDNNKKTENTHIEDIDLPKKDQWEVTKFTNSSKTKNQAQYKRLTESITYYAIPKTYKTILSQIKEYFGDNKEIEDLCKYYIKTYEQKKYLANIHIHTIRKKLKGCLIDNMFCGISAKTAKEITEKTKLILNDYNKNKNTKTKSKNENKKRQNIDVPKASFKERYEEQRKNIEKILGIKAVDEEYEIETIWDDIQFGTRCIYFFYPQKYQKHKNYTYKYLKKTYRSARVWMNYLITLLKNILALSNYRLMTKKF